MKESSREGQGSRDRRSVGRLVTYKGTDQISILIMMGVEFLPNEERSYESRMKPTNERLQIRMNPMVLE